MKNVVTCKCCGESLQIGNDEEIICYKCGATNVVSHKHEHVEKIAKSNGSHKKRVILNVLSVCVVIVAVLLLSVQAFSGSISSDASSSSAIVQQEETAGDVTEENSGKANTKTGIKYSKDTLLDAWNYAMAYLSGEAKETYYGRSSTMSGSLDIAASGLPSGLIPSQTFVSTAVMDSEKNIYQYTLTKGYATFETKVYANAEQETVWSIMNGEKKKRTYAEYAAEEGNTPNGYPLIINSSTIIKSSVKFSIDNGYYKYEFSLDPQASTVDYSKKIQTSGADYSDGSAPTFKYETVRCWINSDGYFYKIERDEQYLMNASIAVYHGTVTCTAKFSEVFTKKDNDAYISPSRTSQDWIW